MPALENPRQEKFARQLVKGKPPYRAYVDAGYRKHESNPYRLSENERVKARITELQERQAMKAVVTADTILQELDEARAHALQLGQTSAAVAASMGKAKIRGLIVDRREVGAPGEFEAMDADALRKWIADAIAGQLVDVTPSDTGNVPEAGTEPDSE